MRVAVFADIHGKFLLPFKLVHLYQQETGNRIDHILQCGDMGAFPDLAAMDRATLRHARRDRDELGFHDDFLRVKPGIARFLDELDVDMTCVRGNHEDHDFLDGLERETDEPRFPIDAYHRVFVCRTGAKQVFRVGKDVLTFIGVGRIADPKGRTHQRFIQDYERKALQKLHGTREDFDLLISHDKESENVRGYGMPELRELLDRVLFRYHFYGHTGEPHARGLASNGITESVKVRELEFNAQGTLDPGCMIVLEKHGAELDLEVVDQHLTNRITRHNWKIPGARG